MSGKITVNGVGKITAAPDTISLSAKLSSTDKDYAVAVGNSANQLEKLKNGIKKLGFDEKALKTSNFAVNADYESVNDDNGRYKRVFTGFTCVHDLVLEFDFDSKNLADVISAVAESLSEPDISIDFTVKNTDKLRDELLKSAVANARKKAELLCAAAGTALGTLVSIDYSSGDFFPGCETSYAVDAKCARLAAPKAVNISPKDIEITDTVKIVWETV